jgi:Fe-S oxidoreductase
MAFPNTYQANLNAPGKMHNMNEVTNEVKIMLGVANDHGTEAPPDRFGARDVPDLTRLNIMNAYACTECGRCTAECPANLTGKKLSPRKIMMDVRDRAEEIGNTRPGQQENKTLLGDYITREEIFACTSCNACVEACPVQIDPLSIILQLRRYTAMEESSSPAEWNSMFSNIETNFAPWKFAASDRFKWRKE